MKRNTKRQKKIKKIITRFVRARCPIKMHRYDEKSGIDNIFEIMFDGDRAIYRYGRRGTRSLLKDNVREFESWHDSRFYVAQTANKKIAEGYVPFEDQDDLPNIIYKG